MRYQAPHLRETHSKLTSTFREINRAAGWDCGLPQTGSQRGLPRNDDDGGHRTDRDLVGTALLGVARGQCGNEEAHAEF